MNSQIDINSQAFAELNKGHTRSPAHRLCSVVREMSLNRAMPEKELHHYIKSHHDYENFKPLLALKKDEESYIEFTRRLSKESEFDYLFFRVDMITGLNEEIVS